MKKVSAKRLISIVLLVAVALVGTLDCGMLSAFASDVIFADDFSSPALAGWKNTASGTVKDGVYSLSGNGYNLISAVGTKDKIQISSDVTVNIGSDANGIMQNSVASLVLCANGDLSAGYEFGIGVTQTGTTYARLYLRGNKSISKILSQKTSANLENTDIKTGTPYNLSFGVCDGEINCYINGNLVISYTDNTYKEGFCGVKTAYSSSVFDNVSVRNIPEKTVSSIELLDTPESVSTLGELEFSVKVNYTDAFYQTETLSYDDPRVSVSGFSRTVGSKNVTVSVGGKSASFDVNVTKDSGESIVFSDNFSNFNKDNYTFYVTEKDEFGVKYGLSEQNGKLVAKLPNVKSSAFNSPLIAKATLVTDYTKNIGKTYSFSADVKLMTTESGTPTKRSTFAEISAFIDDYGKVYKFRLYSTGNLQLYRDDSLLLTKTVASVSGALFELSKEYNLCMAVSDGILICSLDGKTAIIYTGAKMDNFTPKAYVSAQNGTIEIDNVKLSKNEKRSPFAAKSVEVRSIVDGAVLKTYQGKEFDISRLYLAVTYIDGSTGNVGIKASMLSGYDGSLKGNQKITVTYGNCKQTINFNYSKYLFYDSFDDGINPDWNVTSSVNTQLSIKNNRLKTDWNGINSDASISMYTDVEGNKDWRNYSVSADISFDTTMTKMIRSGQMISLYFRRTGSTYYDLRLITRGGAVSMSLYRYVKGKTSELIASITQGQINAKFGGLKTASNGTLFNLKALCKDSTIYIYIDDILLTTVNDTAEDAPYAGYAGMKIAKVSGSVDNFTVEEKGPYKIDSIEVEGLKDNTFEIYQGFVINSFDYKIKCHDADGTVFTESLTDEMISDYDNISVGTQNITITAYGKKQNAKVVVKSREKYIKKLDKDLKKLSVKKLKLADKDKVYDLANRYDELSGYEISKLSDKSVKNMKSAREKMETLVYPEIKDSKILYSNDFNDTENFDKSEWSDGIEKGKGVWQAVNGAYRVEQERYNVSATALRVVDGVYAKLDSVSARMMMLSESMYMGFAFNISDDGYYITRVKMDSFDENGNVNPILQFIKDDVRVFTEYLSGYGLDIKANEWFNLEVTFVNDKINVYVNDTLIISFDDSESANYYTEGKTGVRLNNGNAKFDNFVMRGTLIDERKTVSVAEPTEYKDDFEDEEPNTSPSHFIEDSGVDDFKVVSKDGNKYYGTQNTDKYTYSYLHVFESDPVVNFKFMSDNAKPDGKFGFFIRMAPETAYIKIGYDYKQNKWFATDTQNEQDCDIFTTYSDDTFKLEKGKWYGLNITAKKGDVTVKVDGKKALALKKVSQTDCGRIGLFAEGASIYIDDLDCKFKNGDVVQDGMLEFTIRKGVYTGACEIESLENQKMIVAGYDLVAVSEDAGATFRELPSDDPYYTGLCGNGGYASCLKLHDGSYIFTRKNDFIVYKSEDYCKSFKQIGSIFTKEQLTDDLSRLAHTMHLNSFSEYQLKDGTWRIFLCATDNLFKSTLTTASSSHYLRVFYSDDGGYSWKESENDSRDISLTWNPDDVTSADWAECKIVKCSDGTLRMYYTRSPYGCMQYTVSKDDGVTWEGQYQIPEMQCAKSSFSVTQDVKNKGTYYLVWVNNNPVIKGSNFSRTRLSLAMSTDGKNWKFLCDIERMPEEIYGNDINSTTPLYQCIDPCIVTTDDYVYVTFGRSAGTDPTKLTGSGTNYHQGLRLRIIRLEKQKLNERKWDVSTVSDMLFTKSIEVTKPIKVRYGVGDLFGFSGGEATLTAIDGTTKTVDTGRLHLVEEPDMYMLGKQTVTLYDSHCIKTSYEIEIVPKYMLNWNVSGNGEVDPQDASILEGDDLKVKLKPQNILYKASVVKVNGKRVFAPFGKLERKNVKEDLDITVVFKARGVLDYLLLLLVLVIVAEAVYVAAASLFKKKKVKEVLLSQKNFLTGLFSKRRKVSKDNG